MIHSDNPYKLFAEYYDLYVGKFDSDLDFYLSYCSKTDNILEIGCGTGRILKHILENGFKITGIDISNEMLEKAREKLSSYEKSGQLSLINSNLKNRSLPERYDKILITFYTFNYIIDKPTDFLKNVSLSIKDKGSLLIDLFYPKSFTVKDVDDKWKEQILSLNNRQIKLKDNRRVLNDIEYRTQIYCENENEITIKTERKYYSPDDIKSLLESAGFKEIMFSVTYSQKDFYPSIDQNTLKNNFIVSAVK